MSHNLKAPPEVEQHLLGKARKAPQPTSAGLIIRQKEPSNLETPLDQVDSYLTPTELFYIRSHFPAPRLQLASYRLRIDGAVRNPLSLSYQQLRAMPPETRVATLECAGNSRVFLIPQVAGAQWELGAVSNAAWTGVPLGALLERAGLEEDACEIVLEGADRGTPKEEPVPPGPISYAGCCSQEKASQRAARIHADATHLPCAHRFRPDDRVFCPRPKVRTAAARPIVITRATAGTPSASHAQPRSLLTMARNLLCKERGRTSSDANPLPRGI